MPTKPGQTLDRVAFTAYFLGAVVPLVGLAYVTERYVLPTLSDSVAWTALIGLVVSIGSLSLGSFFVLRRTTHRALRRMDRDNERLGSLLDVSTSLTNAQDSHDAAAMAARTAIELANADVGFVLLRDNPEGEPVNPVLLEAAGERAAEAYESHGKMISELANLVMREGRPALRGAQLSDRADGTKAMGAAAVLPIPGDPDPLGVLAVLDTGTRSVSGREFDPAQVDSMSTLGALASVALRNAELRDAQRNFFAHLTEILVTALDAHVPYHRGHGKRVAQLANLMGRELGLDDKAMQRLHFGGLLHDIGMLKMERPEKMNPKSSQKHTVIGGRMLGGIRLWAELAPIVKSHHERWDGTGYPEGTAGADIPLESRIIAICDAFDSMTSNTSYKVAVPMLEGLREIELSAGTQFDPELARTFSTLIERGIITAEE